MAKNPIRSSPSIVDDREGALLVRSSRGEGCDSVAGLAKSDPRAP